MLSRRGGIVSVSVILASVTLYTGCNKPECGEIATCVQASANPERGADAGFVAPTCESLGNTVAFCWDYSLDPADETRFLVTRKGAGARTNFVTDVFQTPPRAGFTYVGVAGSDREASFGVELGELAHVRFSASYLIEALPTMGGPVVLAAVEFVPDHGASSRFRISVGKEEQHLTEEELISATVTPDVYMTVPTPLAQPIPIRTWTRVAIEVSLAASSAVVTVDGTEAARGGVKYASGGKVRMSAGIVEARRDVEGGAVYVDDMLVESLP